jgi:uncharacterized protein (TIGR03067 family)
VKKLLVVLTVGLLFGVATAGEDAKKALKKFEGTWSVVSVEKDGKKAPEGEISDVQCVFSGENLSFKKGDKTKEGTIKIDPSKKPAHIDITHDGKTAMGIYSFTKDELKLCISETERPTEFTTKEGTKTTLIVLKREKK